MNVQGELTRDSIHGDDEGEEYSRDDQSDNETPPWQVGMTSVDSCHGHGEAASEDENIPPHRYLGVDLHLLAMGVSRLATAFLSDDLNDVLAVPNEHMSDGSTDGKVGADLGQDLGGSKPRETGSRELRGVEEEVVVENSQLVVWLAVLLEERLREEREVLAIPTVRCKSGAKRDAAQYSVSNLRENETETKSRTCRSWYQSRETAE